MNTRLRPFPLFEWGMTAILLLIPVTVMLTPANIERGAFRFLVDMGFTPLRIVVFYLSIGTLRAAALVANGRWRYGTHVRGFCATFAAFIWFMMGLALILLTTETGTYSPGIPVYLVLCVCECESARRVAIEEAMRRSFGGLRVVSDRAVTIARHGRTG